MASPDPRAADTRNRLIAAGLELFGRYGFDGVTTRQLADAAQVNQAAIPYHFGGKEGVYRAVADHIAHAASLRFEPMLAKVRRRLRASPARRDLEALLIDFAADLARIIYAPEYGNAWFSFASREQFHPSAAFDRLYETSSGPLHELVEDILGRLSGADPKAPANVLLAHAFLGQIVGFANGRATLNRRLGRDGDFGPEEIDGIIEAASRLSRMLTRGMRPSPGRQ